MRHEPTKGFSFELPNGWRQNEYLDPITFIGPKGDGQIGNFIFLVSNIFPQFREAEARERHLSEPGATVHRTVVGDEQNAVILKRTDKSEISIVRDGIHYVFIHGHDLETLRAIELVMKTARFPTAEEAVCKIQQWSDPTAQLVTRVLNTGSPEEARDILVQAGAPGVRVSGGTLHDLEPKQQPSQDKDKRWWQFWK